jgi:hypothetical protein
MGTLLPPTAWGRREVISPQILIEQQMLEAQLERGAHHRAHIGLVIRVSLFDRQSQVSVRERSAFVAAKSIFCPVASQPSLAPGGYARKPQPVYVANSTATSGSRMPAKGSAGHPSLPC